ncbi:hypothetical protein O3M35_001543 [Rhynocoris fuscipes]
MVPTMSALDSTTDPQLVQHQGGGNNNSDVDDINNVCFKEECIHTASYLLDAMDLTTEPCDDFYQFVCGKFRKQTIPDDKESVSTFNTISEIVKSQLRTIVSEPFQPDEPRHLKNPKNLYQLCMDKEKIEQNGLDDAKKIIDYFGGWPVVEGDRWDMGSFDWKEMIYKFRAKGFSVDYLLDFSVSVDSKNSTTRIIELDSGSLALSRKYFIKGLEDKLVAAYYSYMVDMAVLLGATEERAKEELMESLNFEIKLSNASLPSEERRDYEKLYNKMSLQEVQQKFPTIPWKEYFTQILGPEITVQEDEPIMVIEPSYITALENILQQTPKRVQANYLMWRTISAIANYMPEKFRQRTLKYHTAISGSKERQARWKECTGIAAGSVNYAVGSLYIKKFFKKESKVNALELVHRIRDEMVKTLQSIDWMDDNTRAAAMDKAKSISEYIGYPDELLDDNKLAEFYQNYDVSNETSYLEAILKTTTFATNYSMSRLRKPVNKTEWLRHASPAVVNAFYNGLENSIEFPAGILQGIFFNNDRPSYMNYGGIGFVIGHEITHGFDDQGRQFDKDGNLNDWWAPETKQKYLQKAQCIIWQYGNYTDKQTNMKLNGINTQGENIADNGGLKHAYRAYNSWVKDHSVEKRLPGLQKYSPKQMFWIAAASTWCSVTRDESLSNRITTGYHSPGEFRVRGPFSNSEDFSRDFNCPIGSMMNPMKKCTVW